MAMPSRDSRQNSIPIKVNTKKTPFSGVSMAVPRDERSEFCVARGCGFSSHRTQNEYTLTFLK